MKKNLAVWRLIKDKLDAKVSVMLLYVLESTGSSPGRQGFFMAVTADKMQGSIGGGMMEQKLVEKAKNKFRSTTIKEQDNEIIKQVHDKTAAKNQSGMICSGEQTVWMYAVQQKDKDAVAQIISCLESFKNGTLQLNPDGIFFQSSTSTETAFTFTSEKDWFYQERLGYRNHLYIIGGGHCSLALSNLMSTLDFYIHLFDNRSNLLTVEQNETAHEKKILNDYSELSSLIPDGDSSYVVVMTFGYRTDDVVVRALFGKAFKYFGLLGSKAKIQSMFDAYKKEGFDETYLQKIHAPIGLQIKSETPEEIAVSIAAEIIKVKNYLTPRPPLQQVGEGESASEVEEPFPKYRVRDKVQFENARVNRKASTEAEAKLWEQLRDTKLGFKFRRQHPVEGFIVDFVCLQKGLIVEVDGEYHDEQEQQQYDAHRTSLLQQKGFTVLRFTNKEVLADVYLVANKIKQAFAT